MPPMYSSPHPMADEYDGYDFDDPDFEAPRQFRSRRSPRMRGHGHTPRGGDIPVNYDAADWCAPEAAMGGPPMGYGGGYGGYAGPGIPPAPGLAYGGGGNPYPGGGGYGYPPMMDGGAERGGGRAWNAYDYEGPKGASRQPRRRSYDESDMYEEGYRPRRRRAVSFSAYREPREPMYDWDEEEDEEAYYEQERMRHHMGAGRRARVVPRPGGGPDYDNGEFPEEIPRMRRGGRRTRFQEEEDIYYPGEEEGGPPPLAYAGDGYDRGYDRNMYPEGQGMAMGGGGYYPSPMMGMRSPGRMGLYGNLSPRKRGGVMKLFNNKSPIQLNNMLRTGMIRGPEIRWNLLDPPEHTPGTSRGYTLMHDPAMSEPATEPPVSFIRVIPSPNYDLPLDWTIDVSPVQPGGYVSCVDVVMAVFSGLLRRAGEREWMAMDPRRRTEISQNYRQRCRLVAGKGLVSSVEEEEAQGIRRIDFLQDRLRWGGLEPGDAPDEFYLKLKTA